MSTYVYKKSLPKRAMSALKKQSCTYIHVGFGYILIIIFI